MLFFSAKRLSDNGSHIGEDGVILTIFRFSKITYTMKKHIQHLLAGTKDRTDIELYFKQLFARVYSYVKDVSPFEKTCFLES
jgi:hypothetical protein